MHQKFCSTGINYFGVVRFLNPFPLFYSFYVSHIGRRKRNVWIFRLHMHWNLKWLKHFSPNKFCYQSPYRSVMTDFSYYIMVKPYDSFFLLSNHLFQCCLAYKRLFLLGRVFVCFMTHAHKMDTERSLFLLAVLPCLCSIICQCYGEFHSSDTRVRIESTISNLQNSGLLYPTWSWSIFSCDYEQLNAIKWLTLI